MERETESKIQWNKINGHLLISLEFCKVGLPSSVTQEFYILKFGEWILEEIIQKSLC